MPTTDVQINDLINRLIDTNTALVSKPIDLMEQLQSALLASASDTPLQGETEELLRLILQSADKSLTTMLSLQKQLQTSIIESYFPAQD